MFLFSPFHNTRRILFPLFFQWILISLCRSNNKGKCNCVSFSLLLVVHTTIYFTMGASWLKKNGRSTCSYHFVILMQRFSLSTQVDAIRECRVIWRKKFQSLKWAQSAVLVPVLYYYYYYYYHHQKCGAQFSFPVLFCRFIPQSLMLTLPSYDPSRYKWKSLGLLVCTQNFLSGFFT